MGKVLFLTFALVCHDSFFANARHSWPRLQAAAFSSSVFFARGVPNQEPWLIAVVVFRVRI